MNATNTIVEGEPSCITGRAYDYILYGLRLRSRMKLTLEEAAVDGTADIELSLAAPDWFESTLAQIKLNSATWVHVHEAAGGWSYVRYDEMFDFLVAPSGDRIHYRLLGPLSVETFQTHALGRVFSLALIKMGVEPLHAATVVVGGRAVAFLGASTFGKSSLAACFVAAQHPLLTDDILRLREENGRYVAFAGPPRLKLLPAVARLFLGDGASGFQMASRSQKFVFHLSPLQSHAAPVPLGVIYAIPAPGDAQGERRIQIQPDNSKEALLRVLSSTHNGQLSGKDRLRRQFEAALRLIEVVPVRKLVYPRILSSLPKVREAVLADLQRSDQW